MRKLILSGVLILFCITSAFASEGTDLSKYELQFDRFGPVVIGMSPNEASSELGVPLIPANPLDKEDELCFYIYPNGKCGDIGFMVEKNKITRIDIFSSNISCSKGIRIGDAEDSVQKAFPGQVKEEIHPYCGNEGKYLIIEIRPGFGFIFETLKGKVTGFRSGRMSSVQYIEGCL